MSRRTRLLPIGAVFLLAACTAAPNSAGPSASDAVVPVPGDGAAASSNRDRPLAEPRRPTRADERAEELAKLSRAAPGPKMAPPPVDLRRRLIGMTANAVQKLLGEPNFERRDPPARIWQYRATGCILDVFMFERANTLTVRHVETRGRTVSQPAAATCFDDLLRRNGTG